MKKKARIIAIINNKGGVGKTMTAQNLAAALAAKSNKVCMIDCDSQHNLTNRCQNKNRVKELSEQLYKGRTIENYLSDSNLDIEPIEVKKNLFLIPSTIALAEYAVSLYNMDQNENPSGKLKELCTYLQEVFDYIVIDSEPGMGALMVNATKAADLIIIPISCIDALSGADEGVFGIMDKNNLNTPYYFLQTMHEGRKKNSKDIRSQLLEEAFENTFKTFIKRNEYLNSAAVYGLDIFEHAPKSAGADDYKDLAIEVLAIFKKLNKIQP